MNNILSSISGPEDLKKLDTASLNQLSGEIREFLIETVLKNGGHLASNLGVIELTCAIHKVFDAPRDKIIWDVGHQCYTHKIICGRRDSFNTLRTYGGISGFPKRAESEYDVFETGHSGTSLSVALGFASKRDLSKENYNVVAVIGDAAFSGGMPLEAINNISQSKKKVIIILNDNQMSIGKNMGAFARYLNRVRTKPAYYNAKRETEQVLDKIPLLGGGLKKIIRKIKGYLKFMITPGVVFEQLGYKYLGPVDGHNIGELCSVLEESKKVRGPVIVHVCTIKGKGYKKAEDEPHLYHGVSASSNGGKTFTAQFGETICGLAEKDASIVCVCPSMVDSCGLGEFAKKYKDRMFDVGIAEEHAVTFAAGLAESGLTPVVAVYSSFLQRAYDSVWHDVALGNRHVVFAIDRAGIVGADGETHQGIYDISYLSTIPNMTVLAPADLKELDEMMRYAVLEHKGPIAVRYPKGSVVNIGGTPFEPFKACVLREGKDITIAALGSMVSRALETADILAKENISAEVIDLRCAAPLDFDTVTKSISKTKRIITLEDNEKSGGIGEKLGAFMASENISAHFDTVSFPDAFIPAGSQKELFDIYGLSPQKIAQRISEGLKV